MTDQPIPDSILALGFEEAMAELETIVRRLEEGKGRLDDAISSYERGALLRRHCEAKLKEAQAKIDKITLGADGAPATSPLDE
ncbi:MAG: exodeoxyribonuclease VII small subunit [Elsteraceae bacterium]|jgi:exodeoxyribonuclease VII small subunit